MKIKLSEMNEIVWNKYYIVEQQQQQQKKSSGVKKRATEMKKEQTERQTPEAGVLPLRATFGFVEATTGGGATPAPALAWKAETGLGF